MLEYEGEVKRIRIEGCEDEMISNRVICLSSAARVLVLLMVLTLSWTAAAQAQEGPADNEYGNPADIPAAADTGGDPGSGGDGVLSASSAPASGIVGILPSTGGASLFVLSAGVLLAGGGLVARRMLR